MSIIDLLPNQAERCFWTAWSGYFCLKSILILPNCNFFSPMPGDLKDFKLITIIMLICHLGMCIILITAELLTARYLKIPLLVCGAPAVESSWLISLASWFSPSHGLKFFRLVPRTLAVFLRQLHYPILVCHRIKMSHIHTHLLKPSTHIFS